MSFMLRDINRYQADVSLLCRRIDQLFGRASALDRQHKAKQFIAAESLAEIIKDLEEDLSWYIKLFSVSHEWFTLEIEIYSANAGHVLQASVAVSTKLAVDVSELHFRVCFCSSNFYNTVCRLPMVLFFASKASFVQRVTDISSYTALLR